MPTWLHVAWTQWRNHAQPIQSLAATVQSLATVLAIIIGAGWALSVFLRKRERFPQLNVEHRVTHWRAEASTVLHLAIRVENKGTVIGRIRTVKAWVEQILPTPDDIATKITNDEDPVETGQSEVPWPLATGIRECDWSAAPREVEPNEPDEFHFDFVLPPHIRAVQVYSHLHNELKRDIGWNTTTPYYSLTGGPDGKATGTVPATAADQSGTGETDSQTTKHPDQEVRKVMSKTFTKQGPPKVTPRPPQPPAPKR